MDFLLDLRDYQLCSDVIQPAEMPISLSASAAIASQCDWAFRCGALSENAGRSHNMARYLADAYDKGKNFKKRILASRQKFIDSTSTKLQ